jgi:hypothetical protein
MKRSFFIVFLVALIGVLSFATVSAASTTGIDVVSLSNSSGTVVVTFYAANGTSPGSVSENIDAFGAVNFFIPNIPDTTLPAGQYSAVVSSNVPVAATVGLTDSTEKLGDDYVGTSEPASTLSFPLIYRNYGSYTSQLVIQNASDSAQNVDIDFFKQGSTTANASDSASIQPMSYAIFDLADYSGFGNDFGGAVVTGSAPLAGTAIANRAAATAAGKAQLTYRAFTASQQGQEILLPLFYNGFNRFNSGINVVNRGGVATDVSVEYTSSNGVAGGPWTAGPISLDPGEMFTFYRPAGLPDNLFGSAVVDSTAADIAVVVSSARRDNLGNNVAFAYEGAVSTSASQCVALPVVHNRTSWKTGINILNLGGSAATVEINYSSSNPSTPDATKTYNVPAGAPLTVYMPTDAATALGFFGGASLESTQDILVLASSANSGAGIARNYVGVNYTCP